MFRTKAQSPKGAITCQNCVPIETFKPMINNIDGDSGEILISFLTKAR